MYATLLRKPLVPFLYFLLLALAYYMPVTLHWTTAVPGHAEIGDSVMHTWPFWYFPYAVSHGLGNLLHPDLQFYPDGISMLYYSSSMLGVLVTYPVNYLLGPMAAVNTWLLLHLWFGGWLFYLFCSELGMSRLAGIFGGTAYACSPFVSTHIIGHYTLVQIAFPALFLLLLAMMLNGRYSTSRATLWLSLSLGVSFTVNCISDFYLGVMTSFLSLAVLADRWQNGAISRSSGKSMQRPIVIAVIAALITLAPWAALALLERQNMDYGQGDPVAAARQISTFQSLISPPARHWLWSYFLFGKFLNDFIFQDIESSYAGLSLIAIAAIGVAFGLAWKRRTCWFIALFLFVGLAGANSFTPQRAWRGTPLDFGQLWPRNFPWADFRVPSRWVFAIQFCLIILASYSLHAIILKWPARRIGITGLALAIACLDFWNYQIVADSGPENTIVSQRSNIITGTVLDFSVIMWSGTGYVFGHWDLGPLKRQMYHGRPILTAFAARLPGNIVQRRQNMPEMRALMQLQKYGDLKSIEGFDWPVFGKRFNISAVRIPAKHPWAKQMKVLGDRIIPNLVWKETEKEWVGEPPK